MKKYALYSVMILAVVFMLSACKDEEPTMGTLSVVVMDSTGVSVPNLQVNLARTSEDLKNHIYIESAYSNNMGAVMFHNLSSDVYWYSASGWDDYGSAKIFTGIDLYAVLWLNNREGKK